MHMCVCLCVCVAGGGGGILGGGERGDKCLMTDLCMFILCVSVTIFSSLIMKCTCIGLI